MEFKDRVSRYPNRRKITYEDGTSEYAKIEYADEPIEIGTPLNRNTLLNLSIKAGTYTGNKVKYDDAQIINLGFTPAIVLVVRAQLFLAEEGTPASHLAINGVEYEHEEVKIVENGFQVGGFGGSNFNDNGVAYNYICMRSAE